MGPGAQDADALEVGAHGHLSLPCGVCARERSTYRYVDYN